MNSSSLQLRCIHECWCIKSEHWLFTPWKTKPLFIIKSQLLRRITRPFVKLPYIIRQINFLIEKAATESNVQLKKLKACPTLSLLLSFVVLPWASQPRTVTVGLLRLLWSLHLFKCPLLFMLSQRPGVIKIDLTLLSPLEMHGGCDGLPDTVHITEHHLQ